VRTLRTSRETPLKKPIFLLPYGRRRITKVRIIYFHGTFPKPGRENPDLIGSGRQGRNAMPIFQR
jgi:hypothetical protein